MMPRRPKVADTDTIQNRNSPMFWICVAPNATPIRRMPSDVMTERATTMDRMPAIISA